MVGIGFQHRGEKVRAFRADHCRACEQSVVALQRRKWTWLSFLWVPLVPLGYRDIWFCQVCSNPTAARPRTALFAKYFCLGLALIFLSTGFTERSGPDSAEDDVPPAASFILGGLGSAFCLWMIIKHKRIPSRRDDLDQFVPKPLERCPVCDGGLANSETSGAGSVMRCEECGLGEKPLE